MNDLKVTICAYDEHGEKLVGYSFMMRGADFMKTDWRHQMLTYKKFYTHAARISLDVEFLKGWDWDAHGA